MSKKNGEDKNTISIKQISEMIFRKQEKRYFWFNYCGIWKKNKAFFMRNCSLILTPKGFLI